MTNPTNPPLTHTPSKTVIVLDDEQDDDPRRVWIKSGLKPLDTKIRSVRFWLLTVSALVLFGTALFFGMRCTTYHEELTVRPVGLQSLEPSSHHEEVDYDAILKPLEHQSSEESEEEPDLKLTPLQEKLAKKLDRLLDHFAPIVLGKLDQMTAHKDDENGEQGSEEKETGNQTSPEKLATEQEQFPAIAPAVPVKMERNELVKTEGAIFIKSPIQGMTCSIGQQPNLSGYCCGTFPLYQNGTSNPNACIHLDTYKKQDSFGKMNDVYRLRFTIGNSFYINEESLGIPKPETKCYIMPNNETLCVYLNLMQLDSNISDVFGYNTCALMNFGYKDLQHTTPSDITGEVENINCNANKDELTTKTLGTPFTFLLRLRVEHPNQQYQQTQSLPSGYATQSYPQQTQQQTTYQNPQLQPTQQPLPYYQQPQGYQPYQPFGPSQTTQQYMPPQQLQNYQMQPQNTQPIPFPKIPGFPSLQEMFKSLQIPLTLPPESDNSDSSESTEPNGQKIPPFPFLSILKSFGIPFPPEKLPSETDGNNPDSENSPVPTNQPTEPTPYQPTEIIPETSQRSVDRETLDNGTEVITVTPATNDKMADSISQLLGFMTNRFQGAVGHH